MRLAIYKGLAAAAGILSLSLLLPSCATTQLYSMPPVHYHPVTEERLGDQSDTAGSGLKVMTLNVAHGRGTGFHQLLQPSDETRANLDSISRLVDDNAPHVIALQEVDGPSFWSGNFNHLHYLANGAEFTHSVQGVHVDAMGLAYGTALMSRLQLSDPRAVTFDPSLSPVPKGFVVSTIGWPGRDDIEVDVVSVHLDFMSGEVRKRQADELIALLSARNNRVIVMGDLNSGWQQQDSAAQYLAERLGLTAFNPQDPALVTFPALDKRLDWILVSPGFEFHSHAVINAGVSDHRGVVAVLGLTEP